MTSLVRQEVIHSARTIVIKVGTNVLSRDDDRLDLDRIKWLVEQIHRIRQTGRKVVLVSSGAVGAGIGLLGLNGRPKDLPHLQAAAAIGQAHLIRTYDDIMRQHGYHAAQLLLTADDFRHRDRYLNVRNTIHTLFAYGAVPIINENDTVSVREVKFGDNDRLAAMVTNLLQNPLLVVLSVVDGLYDDDPSSPNAKRIPLIDNWNDELMGLAKDVKSSRGTGGMFTKLEAVRMATAVGECVIIANGRDPASLEKVLRGEDVGTLFMAKGGIVPAWKRWIGFTVTPRGRITLDAGAVHALEHNGKSLLPIGVANVEGSFEKGELVSLIDTQGQEFARGLTNYDSATAMEIVQKRTDEIQARLGNAVYEELIHRDNLCLTR